MELPLNRWHCQLEQYLPRKFHCVSFIHSDEGRSISVHFFSFLFFFCTSVSMTISTERSFFLPSACARMEAWSLTVRHGYFMEVPFCWWKLDNHWPTQRRKFLCHHTFWLTTNFPQLAKFLLLKLWTNKFALPWEKEIEFLFWSAAFWCTMGGCCSCVKMVLENETADIKINGKFAVTIFILRSKN